MLEQPIYSKDNKVIITPIGKALARYNQEVGDNLLITLQDKTTFIRIYAITKDIFLKWADNDEDYCKGNNFDEVIIAGQYVDFGVPLQADGTLYTRITFCGREAGASLVVIEK